MKLEVKLDDVWVGDWQESVAEIIKDELNAQVRTFVRKTIKAQLKAKEKELLAKVQGLSAETLARILKNA